MKEITIEELKQMRIWMLWRRKEADGRVAKIPCSARGKVCHRLFGKQQVGNSLK